MTPGGPPPHTATAPRGDLLNEVAAPQREPGDAVPSSGPRAGESARGRSVDEDTRGVQQRMTTGMGWGYVMGYIYIYYIYIYIYNIECSIYIYVCMYVCMLCYVM